MKVIEFLVKLAAIMLVLGLCAAGMFGMLRIVQIAGLESDTSMGRAASALAAIAGVALAIGAAWLVHRRRK